MECPLSYLLLTPSGQQAGNGGAKAAIDPDKEELAIKPSSGDTMVIPVSEIVDISGEDYKVSLSLESGEKLVLSELGYNYDDFLRILTKLRSETAQKEMLMKESEKKAPVVAYFTYSAKSGNITSKGDCTLALLETGLIVTLANGEPLRFPYSDIAQFKEEDSALLLETEDGETLRFSKMGWQFDPAKTALSGILNALSLSTQNLLREMLPGIDQLAIRKIAALMRDGKAARKADIEAISPKAWKGLEDKLASAGMKKEYEFLKSVSQQDNICIGIKRGLMGGLSGDYIWFIAPVYSLDPRKPGNAIAMEAYSLKPPEEGKTGTQQAPAAPAIRASVSPGALYPDLQGVTESDEPLDKAGRATYLFRIIGRKEYAKAKSIGELDAQADTLIRAVNRCMLAINFRREPIYLDEEKLEESQYKKYRLAVRRILALQTLRQLFIGRVIHSSPEQWQKDVGELLALNTRAQDDNTK